MRRKCDKNARPWLCFRTFPHSNSKRRIEDRFKSDEQEAFEYTTSFTGNRHRRGEIPNVYDDDYPDCTQKKYISKAKKNKWNHHETIRKRKELDMNKADIEKICPVGATVVLDQMDDIQAPPIGATGKVSYIDDIGNIRVQWETGSSLALIPGVDRFHVVV